MKRSLKGFYTSGERGERGVGRKQFHVLLSEEEREKLVKLSHKLKLNAADVFRSLLAKARV